MNSEIVYEDANPNPEYLLKSIAEQGYSLETSLADLIDNSISANANKIEILINIEKHPYTLFIADNGKGMSKEILSKSMLFPSQSIEADRVATDLGRFGLGMKTASFAQTRCFTILSKEINQDKYNARTWDINYISKEKKWKIKVNSENEITELFKEYEELSKGFLSSFENYKPNTIIIWKGLYKFEKYINSENKNESLRKEITEITSEYLSLVFHKFLERKTNPVNIRINNTTLKPFNPFPESEIDVRRLEYKEKLFGGDIIRMEGYILPSRSIDESKNGNSIWTTNKKSLMDMEGIYIYRADRIIFYSGWLGLIKKNSKLQLARIKVEVGNKIDHLLHLNVAKSKVVVPHDLLKAFLRYVEILKIEAEKEFWSRGIKSISSNIINKLDLFIKNPSNKGMILALNKDYPLIQSLYNEIDKSGQSKLNFIFKMINSVINKIRQTHDDINYAEKKEGHEISEDDLESGIKNCLNSDISADDIKKHILTNLGYKVETLPQKILDLLK